MVGVELRMNFAPTDEPTSLEETIARLRQSGCSRIDTIIRLRAYACAHTPARIRLRDTLGLTLAEAKGRVHLSETWADARAAHDQFLNELFSAIEEQPVDRDR